MFQYLVAGVLWVAVQIGQHTGEGVDVGINLGVVVGGFFRATVLNETKTRNDTLVHKFTVIISIFLSLQGTLKTDLEASVVS